MRGQRGVAVGLGQLAGRRRRGRATCRSRLLPASAAAASTSRDDDVEPGPGAHLGDARSPSARRRPRRPVRSSSIRRDRNGRRSWAQPRVTCAMGIVAVGPSSPSALRSSSSACSNDGTTARRRRPGRRRVGAARPTSTTAATDDRRRRTQLARVRPPPARATTTTVAARCRPVHAGRLLRRPRRDVGRAVDPPRSAPTCPTRSTSPGRWPADDGVRRRHGDRCGHCRGRRRPQRARRRRPRRPVVVPLHGRWLDQPRRAGGAAPTGADASCASPRRRCQHCETGFYAAHRDIAAWAPDLVVFLGDFIYEGAGTPIGRDRVRCPRRPRDHRPRRLPGARTPSTWPIADLQAARAAARGWSSGTTTRSRTTTPA